MLLLIKATFENDAPKSLRHIGGGGLGDVALRSKNIPYIYFVAKFVIEPVAFHDAHIIHCIHGCRSSREGPAYAKFYYKSCVHENASNIQPAIAGALLGKMMKPHRSVI